MGSAPENASKLDGDRPIETASEDVLDRSSFAAHLAARISSWRGRHSLVMGLCGPWGVGKTSIVNMMIERLGTMDAESRPCVKRFDPWLFSAQDEISEAFLSTIASAVIEVDKSPEGKETAQMVRQQAGIVAVSRIAIEPLRKGASWLLGVLGVSAVGSGELINAGLELGWDWLPALLGAGFVIATSAMLSWSDEVLQAIAKLRETDPPDEPLAGIAKRDELSRRLHNLGNPVLIVIDDIDRLPPQQIAQIMQLVKANGNLPNLVYLLVFERSVIEAALDDMASVGRQSFLDKIVQVLVEVPSPSRNQVEKVLFKGLNDELSDGHRSQFFEQERWSRILQYALREYIISIRDVKRYLSSASTAIAMMDGDGGFEVNPIDLIAIEAIRIFDPSLFVALRTNREALIDEQSAVFADTRKQALEGVVAASGLGELAAKRLLVALFPGSSPHLGYPSTDRTDSSTWSRTLRICSKTHFEKYFGMALQPTELSQGEVNRLMAAASAGRDEVEAIVDGFISSERTDSMFERLEAVKTTLDKTQIINLGSVLLDLGDTIEEQPSMFSRNEDMAIVRVLYHAMKKLSTKEREDTFLETMRLSEGLFSPAYYVSLAVDPQSEVDEFGHEVLTTLKNLVVTRIRRASADRLWAHRRLVYLLARWADWGSIEEVRDAFERSLGTSQERFLVAADFATTSQNPFDGAYLVDVSSRSLPMVYRPSLIEKDLGLVDRDALDDRQQAIHSAMVRTFIGQGQPEAK